MAAYICCFFLWSAIINYGGKEEHIAQFNRNPRVRMNRDIRASEVRLLDVDGKQLGIMKIEDAIKKSEENGLDLIEISSKTTPPVCRILDYSKFKYEKEKKLREARKKQHISQVKEVRIRPRIGAHDLDVKLRHIKEFIERKDRVKVSVIFYGRENTHRELGVKIIEKIQQTVEPFAVFEGNIKREGNRISLMVLPKK